MVASDPKARASPPQRDPGLHITLLDSRERYGAVGSVGSMVTQLAREFGAYAIGTGRAANRQKALDFGAIESVDLENDAL